MLTPFVLFDVGANWGTDSLGVTASNPFYETWAFEPTPELATHLRAASISFSARYRVIEAALSDEDGTAAFNVSAHADWGTSSLLEFNDGLSRTWPGREDFYVDRTVEVQVARFDTWFRQTRPALTRIDFFHCDTQGADLRVLRGMGDYVHLIVEGVVETPTNSDVRLYKGQHTKEEILDFLAERNFEVFRVESQQNEDNLFFRKRGSR